MKLVFLENNQPVTDSLTVSDVFGKRHADVLRSIQNMDCSKDFTERNFALSNYKDTTGRELTKYLMTQDGFMFLVMGYTGKEAAQLKESYINEFNRMKEVISNKVEIMDERKQRIVMMQTMIDHDQRLETIEDRIQQVETKVEEQITIDSGQQRTIQKAIARKVYGIEQNEKLRSSLFRQLHREIKDRWAVPSYKDVRKNELNGLLDYIEAWRPIAS